MLGASLSPLYLELRISIGRIGMSLSCQLREIEVLAGRLVPGAQPPELKGALGRNLPSLNRQRITG
jgi:hypothetical protein